METVYLTRRNLLTLINKLDRTKSGDVSNCALLKLDKTHPVYPQSADAILVVAVEDEDYYTDREPGAVHQKDLP